MFLLDVHVLSCYHKLRVTGYMENKISGLLILQLLGADISYSNWLNLRTVLKTSDLWVGGAKVSGVSDMQVSRLCRCFCPLREFRQYHRIYHSCHFGRK